MSSWLRIRPPPPLLPRSALPTLRPSLLLARILHRKQLRRRRLRRPVSLRKKSHLVRVLCCEMFFSISVLGFCFSPLVVLSPSLPIPGVANIDFSLSHNQKTRQLPRRKRKNPLRPPLRNQARLRRLLTRRNRKRRVPLPLPNLKPPPRPTERLHRPRRVEARNASRVVSRNTSPPTRTGGSRKIACYSSRRSPASTTSLVSGVSRHGHPSSAMMSFFPRVFLTRVRCLLCKPMGPFGRITLRAANAPMREPSR